MVQCGWAETKGLVQHVYAWVCVCVCSVQCVANNAQHNLYLTVCFYGSFGLKEKFNFFSSPLHVCVWASVAMPVKCHSLQEHRARMVDYVICAKLIIGVHLAYVYCVNLTQTLSCYTHTHTHFFFTSHCYMSKHPNAWRKKWHEFSSSSRVFPHTHSLRQIGLLFA